MVDKIVQLVDVDNNNVYPVAGSLKQGSVTTSTINDGAVTAAKINFSSLTTIVDSVPLNTTKTLQLTPGRWLIFAWCTILTTANSSTPKLAFVLNGDEYLSTFAGNTPQQMWENLAIEDLVTVSAGDVFQVKTDLAVNNPTKRSRIVAIKLG